MNLVTVTCEKCRIGRHTTHLRDGQESKVTFCGLCGESTTHRISVTPEKDKKVEDPKPGKEWWDALRKPNK